MLLHLLLQAGRQRRSVCVRALHVNHGLQSAAAEFQKFCRRTARQWRVPLAVVKARVDRTRGSSLEEAARNARYAALRRALAPGELLLTAQHADDQLETMLLALLRGAGPAGLAAMPAVMPFGTTQLLRPLLAVERSALESYAAQHQLRWQDDPTNDQQRFDRNFLRASVVPVLRERWPAVARTVGRSAGHCAVAALALADAARRDLEAAADGPDLEVAILRRLSKARLAAVLRLWIADHGGRAPEARHIEQIMLLMNARVDAHPELRLPALVVRRQAGRLQVQARANVMAGSRPIC